jgi:phosphatidate cytidylyltransferase
MSTDAATDDSAPPNAAPPAEPAAGVSEVVPAARPLADLGPRLLSAVALMPVAIAAAVAGGPWLAGATGAAVVIMSYEWARMSAPQAVGRAVAVTLAASFGAVILTGWRSMDVAAVWIAACAAAAFLVRVRPGVGPFSARAEALFGVVYIAAPPAAFLWLRAHPDGGAVFVLGLFAVIWSADVAAYFGGRLIGGPKFLPRISPNKTWAGVCAGFVAGAAAGVALGAVLGSSLGPWALAGLALAAAGLVGDLLESAIKRRFGVKDASRIIPGHGGMLDRLDGLITATVLAAAMVAYYPGLAEQLTGAAR